jgi:hypothetical protein
MDESPKRSTRDTVTQLVVIAILLALIVASLIFLRQYVDSRNTSDGSNAPATFSFTCCTGYDDSTVYHPGDEIRLSWTPVRETTGADQKETITLTAMLSKRFRSASAIKSGAKVGKGVNIGPFSAESSQRVSNRSDSSPVIVIRIPKDARAGYYDLVTSATQRGQSVSDASILRIRR